MDHRYQTQYQHNRGLRDAIGLRRCPSEYDLYAPGNWSMARPTVISLVRERLESVNRERWFRLVVQRKKRPREQGFFDQYSRFFTTSNTRAEADRLNQRHRALIESNVEVIRGRRVLDIASHDGRWSLSAKQAGAEYVLGIEARERLVEEARRNMQEYGVPGVEFIQGDVMPELDRLEPGQFDTVFCFGFLYHTSEHMALFRKIARLKPSSIAIDTAICTHNGNLIEVRNEATIREGRAAIAELGSNCAVVGKPTKAALELMLRAVDFPSIRYYDWRKAGIQRWDDLKDYYLGARISATANRSPAS
jgi:2-polyprenyl-3-methyl-5-hydroxy-6-metoxy-1,4-benzoquinol methylase